MKATIDELVSLAERNAAKLMYDASDDAELMHEAIALVEDQYSDSDLPDGWKDGLRERLDTSGWHDDLVRSFAEHGDEMNQPPSGTLAAEAQKEALEEA